MLLLDLLPPPPVLPNSSLPMAIMPPPCMTCLSVSLVSCCSRSCRVKSASLLRASAPDRPPPPPRTCRSAFGMARPVPRFFGTRGTRFCSAIEICSNGSPPAPIDPGPRIGASPPPHWPASPPPPPPPPLFLGGRPMPPRGLCPVCPRPSSEVANDSGAPLSR